MKLDRIAASIAVLTALGINSAAADFAARPAPALAELESFEAVHAASFGNLYDGSADRSRSASGGASLAASSPARRPGLLSRLLGPSRGGRRAVPAPEGKKPGLMRKAGRFAAGPLLGLALFGGLVGALAGVTLLAGLRVLGGKVGALLRHHAS